MNIDRELIYENQMKFLEGYKWFSYSEPHIFLAR